MLLRYLATYLFRGSLLFPQYHRGTNAFTHMKRLKNPHGSAQPILNDSGMANVLRLGLVVLRNRHV